MESKLLRLTLQAELKQLDTLERAVNGCRDAGLRALLGEINQRKTRRLTQLVNGPDQPINPTVDQAAPELTSSFGQSAASVTRPATAAEGVAVLECQQLTPELIRFTVPRPLDFSFRAGQSVKVELDGIRRSYSIVSAPHEEVLEFFIELVPGGQMSARLRQLKPGDRIGLGKPKGGLSFDGNYPHHLMIATVTGINPFISILRDAFHQGLRGHHFHVLHGASYQNEFGYRDELESLASHFPDLVTYLPTVSRSQEPANSGWNGSQGRVDAIVEPYRQQAGLQPDTTRIYACGHSGMLDVISQQYRPMGYQVVTENYD